MKRENIVSQNGYSIVEILIVLAITGILTSLAVGQFGTAKTSLKRQNIARELKVNLERARFDSVKRRAENSARAEVTLVNSTSFTVKTDINQNGKLDASDIKTIDFSGQSDIKLVGSALVYPISIKFDRYGRIEAEDGTKDASGLAAPKDITPIFTVCTGGCTSDDATAANGDVIYVSPSGTVAMLKGGEKKPVFTSPSNSVVPVNSYINDQIRINSSGSGY